MEVLLDSGGNYSVAGYNERAANSFGRIYLGLDEGPEYDRQATRVNAAIQSISAPEAFAVALRAARNVLAGNSASDDPTVVFRTLAAICRLWFDLPDSVNMVEGPPRIGPDPAPPALCPGDFIFPSGHIFSPVPDSLQETSGPPQGRLIRAAVTRYLAGLRASGRLPSGVLSRAVFDAFPSGEDDLIARTIVGVMIGMLPTVALNLVLTLAAWRAEGRFAELQKVLQQHAGGDPFARASEVLREPLIETMQAKGDLPVPHAVWRTAVKDHMLGTEQVRKGDRIHVDIASATRADRQAGIADPFPIFGGDRQTTPHPTHACPGYRAAIGVMLGVLNGVMEPR
jgi:hypothetical protein